jgi:hypothetical protein
MVERVQEGAQSDMDALHAANQKLSKAEASARKDLEAATHTIVRILHRKIHALLDKSSPRVVALV